MSLSDTSSVKVKQVLVKYPDCNATENLFGGKLMSWIDEAAAIYASQHMGEDLVVTVHFSGMDFMVPVELRSIVSIYVWPIKQGKTSLKVGVKATKRTMGQDDAEEVLVSQCHLVFVAVDNNGNKHVWKPERFGIPELKVEEPEDKKTLEELEFEEFQKEIMDRAAEIDKLGRDAMKGLRKFIESKFPELKEKEDN